MSLVLTKNHIKNKIVLVMGVEKGTVIGLETTGLPDQKEHEIVCVGYITFNKLIIL